jgi:hypothetical protein
MSQYRTGTVSVTNGSQTVTGDITLFTSNVNTGDLFTVVNSNVTYEILSVTDDTHCQLTVPYAGASMTGQSYTIARDFTPAIGLPYIQKGDIETATILKAAFMQLDELIDFNTDVSSPLAGQALVYSGSQWVNQYLTETGTITSGTWYGTAIGAAYGGTGLTSTTTNGQLLIGNGSGYTLANLSTGAGITVTNGAGTITITNTGVTSAVAGTGVSVSSATGAVTIANTGVLSNIAGTGISISGGTGNVTITNAGVVSVAGTTNQVNVSGSTGAVTLSLPQSIASTSTPTFAQVTISNTPVNASDTATKLYVDSVAQGLDIKTAVIAASTANVTVSSPGTSVFDGITLSTGQRILLKNQTTASQNGVYIFNGSSSALTRSTDFNGVVDGNTVTTWAGSTVFVEEGTVNAGTFWVLTSPDPNTIGTSSLTFTQFGGPGTYTAGTGLSLSGTTFSNAGVTSVSGTSNVLTASASTGAVTLNISASYAGQTSINTVGTVTTGVWNGSPINLSTYASGTLSPTYGGTGVNNGSNTLTLNGNLTFTGAFTTNFTLTGNTSVTLPTSGTLVNSAVSTLSSLSSVGTIGTGTWNGTAIGATYGGTGQTTYALGDLIYASSTSALSRLAMGTSGQILTAVTGGAPTWATVAGVATFANPTVTVGLTAKNGTATTVLRGDGAPALDQSIAPTWTSAHTFSAGLTTTTATVTGSLAFSNTNSITATGSTQGTAYVLTSDTSTITTCASGAGVVLPTGIGREITVINRGANALLVYPASGYAIDGTATNAPVSVPSNGWLTVNVISSSQYFTIDPVTVGGTGVSVTQSNNGTITIANTGVTSLVAGTGITLSGSTGAVTVNSNGGVTSITGTTDQVITSSSTGAITLSLPQNIDTGANVTFGSVTTGGSLLSAPSSYGSLSISGSTGGYAGIQFSSASNLRTFMVQASSDGVCGMYDVSSSAWEWYWTGGTLTQGTIPAANVSGNISGTAAGITGLTIPAAGSVPGANGIPRTDSNGYLYTYYINDSSPVESLAPTYLYGNNGSDGFIRKTSTANVTVGGATNATNATYASNVTCYGGRTDGTAYPVLWANPGGTTANQPTYACNNVTITSSTGTLNATAVNATSDRNKKENIRTINDADSIIASLNGVRFNWKDNNLPSAGLIAQDVEAVMPELVTTGDDGFKGLNYNGIIGALVEAVKNLQAEVAALKAR